MSNFWSTVWIWGAHAAVCNELQRPYPVLSQAITAVWPCAPKPHPSLKFKTRHHKEAESSKPQSFVCMQPCSEFCHMTAPNPAHSSLKQRPQGANGLSFIMLSLHCTPQFSFLMRGRPPQPPCPPPCRPEQAQGNQHSRQHMREN